MVCFISKHFETLARLIRCCPVPSGLWAFFNYTYMVNNWYLPYVANLLPRILPLLLTTGCLIPLFCISPPLAFPFSLYVFSFKGLLSSFSSWSFFVLKALSRFYKFQSPIEKKRKKSHVNRIQISLGWRTPRSFFLHANFDIDLNKLEFFLSFLGSLREFFSPLKMRHTWQLCRTNDIILLTWGRARCYICFIMCDKDVSFYCQGMEITLFDM